VRTEVLAAGLGGTITYLGVKTMPLNALLYALAFAAIGALVAGWIARRRGPLVGITSMLAAAAIWAGDVLITSWANGQLGLQFPDCDPCGLGGYAGRLIIVAAIGAPYFVPVGALGGWIGSSLRGRVAPA
jgi:hypothetical protein